MKIAMIGQKGVPATHGGVERHVEELGARLTQSGHEVTVFTRPNYTDPELREYRGMRLRSLPTIGTKHLDAIVHSLLATLACCGGGYDIVHYHAMGPCLASPIARLRGRKVVATIHGQDWRRDKWGRLASLVLRLAEYLALRVPHVTISVSDSLARAYKEDTGREVRYVPNGITIESGDDTSVLQEFGLHDGEYILSAGRLVPEKGVHYLIEALSHQSSPRQLVIVGESSNTAEYVADLRASAAENVVFTGYQYGAKLAALFRHAALYVLPSDLEGLPIVLLEALAYGVPVLASDIAPNKEVLGSNGEYFHAGDVADLTRALDGCLDRLSDLQMRATEMRPKAIAAYDWEQVASQTAVIYAGLLAPSAGTASA